MRTPFTIKILTLAPLAGCVAQPANVAPTVADAWSTQATPGRTSADADAGPWPGPQENTAASPTAALSAEELPIATVDGRPIPRRRIVDLLLRSKGPALLEQMIVLDAAERLAAQQGVTVTQASVDREYDMALRRLIDPLAAVSPDEFDRTSAEHVLNAVLLRRNISREEYLLGVRRNTYLRRIAEATWTISEDQLQAEFARRYGLRVRIRHIQLATPAEVARVQQALATGAEFSDLARTFSANLASAAEGGLLEPFSVDDDQVPKALREIAFSLSPSEVSGAIRIGEWYHLVQVVGTLPAEPIELRDVREELTRRIRDRAVDELMQDLHQKLFFEAEVRIHDPALGEAFRQAFPGPTGNGGR